MSYHGISVYGIQNYGEFVDEGYAGGLLYISCFDNRCSIIDVRWKMKTWLRILIKCRIRGEIRPDGIIISHVLKVGTPEFGCVSADDLINTSLGKDP